MDDQISEEDRTTGLGIARYSLEHFAAALASHSAIIGDWRDKNPSAAPVYSLAGQAIELALKAFLREQGSDLAALKKIGHNLSEAMESAEKIGFQSKIDMAQLTLLNEEYSRYRFRYIRTGVVSWLGAESLFRLTADVVTPAIVEIEGAWRFMWHPAGKFLSDAGVLSASAIHRASKAKGSM